MNAPIQFQNHDSERERVDKLKRLAAQVAAVSPLPGPRGPTGATGPIGPTGPAGTDGVVLTISGGTGINVNVGAPTIPVVSIDQTFVPNWTGVHKFNASGGTRLLSGTTTVNANPIAGDPAHLIDIVNDTIGTPYQVIRISTYGAAGSVYQNNLHWQRANGTVAVPTAVQSGDFFMSMGYRGHDGTAISQSAAAFTASATENWTGAAHGIKFQFETTPNGSVTRGVMFNIADDNVYTPGAGLTVGATAPVNTAAGRGNITVNGASAAITNLAVAGALIGFSYADATQMIFGASANVPVNFRTNATTAFTIETTGRVNFVGGAGNTVLVGDGAGDESLALDGGAGQLRLMSYRSAGLNRWATICENTVEAGANAGSNFELWSFTDAGGFLNTALSVRRSDSHMTLGGVVQRKSFTVATLPVGVAGDTAYVTDALAPAFGAAVAGAGAVGVPVYKDGANWKVG